MYVSTCLVYKHVQTYRETILDFSIEQIRNQLFDKKKKKEEEKKRSAGGKKEEALEKRIRLAEDDDVSSFRRRLRLANERAPFSSEEGGGGGGGGDIAAGIYWTRIYSMATFPADLHTPFRPVFQQEQRASCANARKRLYRSKCNIGATRILPSFSLDK